MAAKDADGEAYITIYGDNKKPYDQDFVADKRVMNKLFEYVLDRHPNFMPAETGKKDSDSEDEIIVATLKKDNKIPKAHVCSYKKK